MKKTTTTTDPARLRDELARERALADTRRADELARLQAEAAHRRAVADEAERTRRAELDRAEREATASANAALARVYREALDAGERTRIQAEMARTAEARALRLEGVRRLNLRVLLPVLIGFATWSTVGVQHGAARLMGVGTDAPMWWVLWLLEPVLIGAVVWVIIARARLSSSGGAMEPAADHIATACLATSIALNLVSSAPTSGWEWTAIGAMLAHAIGPVGAAATAHLIGVIDRSIAKADPWHDEDGRPVPRLADLSLSERITAASEVLREDSREESQDSSETTPEPLPAWVGAAPESARLLPLVARPQRPAITAGTPAEDTSPEPERSTSDLRQDRTSEEVRTTSTEPPRKRRANAGRPLPKSLRKTSERSPRSMTDAELVARLDALQTSGELPTDASKSAMQRALGIGYERLQRVLERRAELQGAAA